MTQCYSLARFSCIAVGFSQNHERGERIKDIFKEMLIIFDYGVFFLF